MKDRQKAVQLTAGMLGFPAAPAKARGSEDKDSTNGPEAEVNHLSDAVQELARQHPRARAKAKA